VVTITSVAPPTPLAPPGSPAFLQVIYLYFTYYILYILRGGKAVEGERIMKDSEKYGDG